MPTKAKPKARKKKAATKKVVKRAETLSNLEDRINEQLSNVEDAVGEIAYMDPFGAEGYFDTDFPDELAQDGTLDDLEMQANTLIDAIKSIRANAERYYDLKEEQDAEDEEDAEN